MYDVMMVFKPFLIKDYKDSHQSSCKIQAKTSNNNIHIIIMPKIGFRVAFILKFNRLTHKTKGIYLTA